MSGRSVPPDTVVRYQGGERRQLLYDIDNRLGRDRMSYCKLLLIVITLEFFAFMGVYSSGAEVMFATGYITAYQQRQYGSVSYPELTVRDESGRSIHVMLHDGIQLIPIVHGSENGDIVPLTDIVARYSGVVVRIPVRFLSSGKAVPAGQKLIVQQRRKILLETIPSAARVLDYDNGSLMTPVSLSVWGDVFESRLIREGYRTNSVRVRIGDSQGTNLRIHLEREKMILVTTVPEGAGVALDGSEIGNSPVNLKLVGHDQKQFRLMVSMDGYQDDQRVITMENLSNDHIVVPLSRKDMTPRIMTIDTVPSRGAKVMIGSSLIGLTPCVFLASGPTNGVFTVLREAPDGTVFSTNVSFDLRETRFTYLSVPLDQEPRVLEIRSHPTQHTSVVINGRPAGTSPLQLVSYSNSSYVIEMATNGILFKTNANLTGPGKKNYQCGT